MKFLQRTIFIFLISSNVLIAQKGAFFVNGGTQQVSELTCYNFYDLCYKIPYNVVRNLDKMQVRVNIRYKGSPLLTLRYFGSNTFENKSDISAQFNNKNQYVFYIFYPEGYEFPKGYVRLKDPFSKRDLKYVINENELEGAYIEYRILGQKITGYDVTKEGYWEGDKYYEKEIRKPIYQDLGEVYSDKLYCKNRILITKDEFKKKKPTDPEFSYDKTCLPFQGTVPTPEECENGYYSPISNISTDQVEKQMSPNSIELPAEKKAVSYKETKHPNGVIATKEWSSGGNSDSVFSYNQTGEVIFISRWKDGRKNGKWVEYSKGLPLKEINYKEGEKDGRYVAYVEGKNIISEEGQYKNGNKHGYWKGYNSFTGKLEFEKNYIDGEENGVWLFYKDGKLWKTETYVNGELTKEEMIGK